MKKSLLFFGFFFIYLVQSFGQGCTPTIYYFDNDGDGFGTNDFDADDITIAQIDYNDSGGQNGISGNILYGCFKPRDYADKPFDCDDNNADINAYVSWYTDEDGDGAFGTRHSGCQTPPSDSRPNRNDWVIFQNLSFYKIILP